MNNSENNNITSEWLKANTKITGWLTLFLALPVGVGSARSFLYQIKEYNAEDYGNNLCLGSVDIFTSLSFLGMAIFIIYSFLNRKRNAVFWTKAYIILSILLNSLNLILNMNADADFIGEKLKLDHENYRLICSIMWGVIWFLYLTFSKHVQEIIPKSFRKVSKLDWGILAAIILIPIALYVIGMAQLNAMDATDSQEIETNIIYQDADSLYYAETEQVKFIIPKGFSCDPSLAYDIEGKDLYAYDLADEVNFFSMATLCSEYKADSSLSNLDRHWEAWKKKEHKEVAMTDVDRGVQSINGNKCLYRICKYSEKNDESIWYWRFYLLFDNETGKSCVLSSYDGGESTAYVDELLSSIQFK
ncbi:MAG: DUF2569 family protein [Paludibacteraceae bacterium]|nr:DUF2569 family protein [Paludibacteraceae bacterium]